MEYEYVINTLDATFGVLGGFMEILWALGGLLVGAYNTFQKEEELVREFYTTDERVLL